MIQVLLAVLLSTGSITKQEARTLQNNEQAVLQKAQDCNIDVARIVDAEDTGL